MCQYGVHIDHFQLLQTCQVKLLQNIHRTPVMFQVFRMLALSFLEIPLAPVDSYLYLTID